MNRGMYSIPESVKKEILEWREDGMGWTSIARQLDDEYGITIHRSTIQRWYADNGDAYEYTRLASAEVTEDDAFLDAKLKLDKKILLTGVTMFQHLQNM